MVAAQIGGGLIGGAQIGAESHSSWFSISIRPMTA
jgi:hypothetical protein